MTMPFSEIREFSPVPPQFASLKAILCALAEQEGNHGVVLTEDGCHQGAVLPFVAVLTPSLWILLRTQASSDQSPATLSLSVDPSVMTGFLKKLRSQIAPARKGQLTKALAMPQPSSVIPPLYQILINKLCDLLAQKQTDLEQLPSAATCRPIVDAALNQQLQQEKLINQVTTHIRQSLELPVILQTAVHQIRACLSVDRLLIYQFEPLGEAPVHTLGVHPRPGQIIYESCSSAAILPLIAQSQEHHWAICSDRYHQYQCGQSLVTAQVDQGAALLDGAVERLYGDCGVRAQVIAPLLVQDQLWGLLIAHHCGTPYDWQPREVDFLEQVAAHLAIAIHQAELYQQLQSQTRTLEEQVMQRTLELSEALAETQMANRVKGEFIATMSHELRTPLTCVIGMSATLIRWSLGPLNDKQRGYLQTIHDSGEHLLELINDILDFSQAESGKATLNLSEFSLTALIQQSIQGIRDSATEHDITLRVNLKIAPERDRFVADARRVKQILFNLLSNAIKFTPAGGEVRLRVWMEPNAAIFQVEDNGIGISPQQQSLLFQKFQQLDTSYRRAYEGAGLGLALTKQLVDMHHGWIEVSSVEGQGSTFTVELPNQTLLNSSEDLVRSRYTTSSNTRIVLIEDQEEVATLICEMLTAAGYHVVWIVENSTARQQIQFLQPAAVIISVARPDGSDLKLVRQLRYLSESQMLKILAIIPKDALQDPQPFLDSGVDAFIAKPLNPEHLIHKIDMLLAVPSKTVA